MHVEGFTLSSDLFKDLGIVYFCRTQTEREIRQEVEELKWSDRLNQIQLTLVKAGIKSNKSLWKSGAI